MQRLISRISRLEIAVGALIAVVLLVLVVIEPNILEAPFENSNTLLFTFGGTALAAGAFITMLWFRVPDFVRIAVLVVPFAVVNWWLLSPYFIDDVVDEGFATSIAAQLGTEAPAPAAAAAVPTTAPVEDPGAAALPATDGSVSADAPAADAPAADATASDTPAATQPDADAAESPDPATSGDAADTAPAAETAPAETDPAAADTPAQPAAPAAEPAGAEPAPAAPVEEEPPPAPTGPVLRGAGQFVGLAGHSGTGVAGIFENPDGSYTLRFEQFDIENGPDLDVYLVPGANQTSLPAGSINLGNLKGNIGDQNYELPAGTELSGTYTVLIWCEAFGVEFVGATVTV